MAFPVVLARATSLEDVGNVTSHTVILPSGIAAGDLLIIFFAADGVTTVSWPVGANDAFTGFFLKDEGNVTFAVGYRQANGSEPATVEVLTGGSQRSAHTSYRITGHVNPSFRPPEASPGVTGASVSPDPDSLTPSAGPKDFLWIAGHGHDRDRTTTAFPTSYINGISTQGAGSASAGVASAERSLNASVEDPGTFTISLSDQWVACTVAIHPIVNTDLLGDASPGSYAFTGAPATLEVTVPGSPVNNSLATLWEAEGRIVESEPTLWEAEGIVKRTSVPPWEAEGRAVNASGVLSENEQGVLQAQGILWESEELLMPPPPSVVGASGRVHHGNFSGYRPPF